MKLRDMPKKRQKKSNYDEKRQKKSNLNNPL